MKKLLSGLLMAAVLATATLAVTSIAAPTVAVAAEPAAAPQSASSQNFALSVWMFSLAVLGSPWTIGGSFGLTAVAWPAVIGGTAAGVAALNDASGNGRPGRS